MLVAMIAAIAPQMPVTTGFNRQAIVGLSTYFERFVAWIASVSYH